MTASSYTRVQILRQHIDKTATADDAILQGIIDAASAAIDNFCHRPDGFVADSRASARIYPGSGNNWLYIDECVEVTQVRVKTCATDAYTTWAATDYLKAKGDRKFPEFNETPYNALLIDPNGDYDIWYADGSYPTVEITARWGYAQSTPAEIEQACIITAARWYKRGQSAWSDVLASGEMGMLLYRQQLDPDVKNLLVGGRFVKPTTGRR